MGYDIRVSQGLIHGHPALLPQLRLLLQEDDVDEDIQLIETPDLLPDVKVVELDDDSGSFQLKMIWLDNPELVSHVQKGTLSRLIEVFRDRYGQTLESHKTVLLLHDSQRSALSRQEIEVEMCWKEIQYPCLHRVVTSVQDAAGVIHSYMNGLLHAMANPTTRERFESYCNMLLAIPGLNPERVRMVTKRYTNMRALWKALKALGPDIEAGRVQLNAGLFTGDPTAAGPLDKWVWNLYHQLTSDDPDLVFFSEGE
ncbi:hypothetical protein V5O48_015826 [Marasmius crinis-equi]|uniref:Uncharacterized protein n=1 Tax=Marasmius crinis-equi TaxID=585013 RepID=A0ABR3ETI6_9AGAR